ncbi:hypothetical protein RUM43_014716 [Polyplax serrata]|uniref:Uncharacterized protein n=1 Tax=Polyplax serrata TaxID=468196 RepID=A0AAN8PB45_POLSC
MSAKSNPHVVPECHSHELMDYAPGYVGSNWGTKDKKCPKRVPLQRFTYGNWAQTLREDVSHLVSVVIGPPYEYGNSDRYRAPKLNSS